MGAAWGALLSVLWIELAILLFAAYLISLPLRAVHRRRMNRRPGGLVLQVLVMVAAIGLAIHAPVKFVDQRLDAPLPAAQLQLSTLLTHLEAHGFLIAPEAVERTGTVALPASRPTYLELDEALRKQAGLSLRIGYCGTSMTLLWGAHQMGSIQIVPGSDGGGTQ